MQGCKYWDKDTNKNSSSSSILSIIKGKKIKRSEYLSLNSDYSDETNLICIQHNRLPPKKYQYNVFFLTHTLSNNIYLNSLVQVSIKRNILVGDDTKEKAKWRHQGTSIQKHGDYYLTFYKYFDEDIPQPYNGNPNYPKSIDIYPYNHEYNRSAKCYANDEYWLAMFPMIKKENVVTKSDKEIKIAQERAKEKQLLEQQKEKERLEELRIEKKKEEERIKLEREKKLDELRIAREKKAKEEKEKELLKQREREEAQLVVINEKRKFCKKNSIKVESETSKHLINH